MTVSMPLVKILELVMMELTITIVPVLRVTLGNTVKQVSLGISSLYVTFVFLY